MTAKPIQPEQGSAVPKHIAIIMDGNGRWATKRGLPRTAGHARGVEAVRPILKECNRLGVEALTLFSLSTENFTRRPAEELTFLMQLYAEYLRAEKQMLVENNIRVIQVGRREKLPADVLELMDGVIAATAGNTGSTLALALNYGSRQEITDAVRGIAEKVKAGELEPGDITEETISEHLYTAGLPEPDLLIRTAGEMRVSNFLLWQISYAELWVTPTCWPDFGVAQLHEALRDYANRQRRFGGVLPHRG